MLVLRAPCFRALANLAQPVLDNERSLRARQAQTNGMNAKEITKMRYRTAPGSFIRYTRHLVLRLTPPKRAP
jgi:hypothetical protein